MTASAVEIVMVLESLNSLATIYFQNVKWKRDIILENGCLATTSVIKYKNWFVDNENIIV